MRQLLQSGAIVTKWGITPGQLLRPTKTVDCQNGQLFFVGLDHTAVLCSLAWSIEEYHSWETSLLTAKCYISISFNDAFMVFYSHRNKEGGRKVAGGLCIQKRKKLILSVVNFLSIHYSSHVALVNIPGYLAKNFPADYLFVLGS